MAIQALLTSSSPVELPKNIVSTIFGAAQETSVVARLSGQAPLSLGGESIPVYDGTVNLGTVAEAGMKPVQTPNASVKRVTPHKVAAIVPFSDELLNNDVIGFFEAVKKDLANAVGRAVDAQVLYGADAITGDRIAGQTALIEDATKEVAVIDGDYVSAFYAANDLVASDYDITGIAADTRIKPQLTLAGNAVQVGVANMAATSATFGGYDVEFSRLVGRSTTGAEKDARMVLGDWSKVRWGFADRVTMKMLDQATILDSNGQPIYLAQQNMKALLVETKIGSTVLNQDAFAVINKAAA